ncbi:MAG TPA: 3-oxoadipate enol-lactonase [Aliiroseovarius sp.]|nr:3-oxoadipate enol-lactonase [Aliiroseovarius sp.]
MQMCDIGGNIRLHYADTGPRDAPVLVLSGSLGTDFRMWEDMIAYLPRGLRVVRYDMRGHGLSTCPDGPYFMGDLVADVAALMERLEVSAATFVGLSIGGMIGQGLAAERPDLVGALVLSNTAAKIGTPAIWDDRIATVRQGGIEAIAFATMERWFARATRRERPGLVEAFLNMLMRQPAPGYLGAMAAIAETDLFDSTARLSLPVMGIAGTEDGSTPADLVRETTELVPGARFELVRNAGHLPPVERPRAYAALLAGFLGETGAL